MHQKSRKPSFFERMGSFTLLPYVSLATWRTLFQRLLASLNFTLIQKIYSVGTNKKNDFNELLLHLK